jgi:hypothetical protein
MIERKKKSTTKIIFFMCSLIANRKRFLNFVAENKQANKSKEQQYNDKKNLSRSLGYCTVSVQHECKG